MSRVLKGGVKILNSKIRSFGLTPKSNHTASFEFKKAFCTRGDINFCVMTLLKGLSE